MIKFLIIALLLCGCAKEYPHPSGKTFYAKGNELNWKINGKHKPENFLIFSIGNYDPMAPSVILPINTQAIEEIALGTATLGVRTKDHVWELQNIDLSEDEWFVRMIK